MESKAKKKNKGKVWVAVSIIWDQANSHITYCKVQHAIPLQKQWNCSKAKEGTKVLAQVESRW